MNNIEEISATYRRIAENSKSELNKVQQQIYRIGTLRLLLFVGGIAGVIYFRAESWEIPAGIVLITLAVYFIGVPVFGLTL